MISQSKRNTTVLFVCGGNTCRSPIAAALMAKAAGDRAITVESAGIDARSGSPASEEAITVLAAFGVDARSHRARDIGELDLNKYDYIVAMKPYIVEAIRKFTVHPTARLITWDVSDPFKSGVDAYRRCAIQIRQLVEEFLGTILTQERAS